MLRRLFFGMAVNIGALWVTSLLLTNFNFEGGITFLLIAGLLLGILNTLAKPVMKLLSFPLIFISAGLFLIVINALMLGVLDYLFDILDITGVSLQVEGALTYLWAAIIFGLVNWLEHWMLKR
ncbi:MAG: phage holin family protein [Patescibacteria group bacterium]|nr:phage holin family protein [Patescibacteria group bacterium]